MSTSATTRTAQLEAAPHQAERQQLPSWNPCPTRDALFDFVARITDVDSPDYVPAPERIAVFDNDGTLWSEQPVYFQLQFAFDRIAELAPGHPEWRELQPYKGLLERDMAAVEAAGVKGVLQILAETHAGMSTDDYDETVADWLLSARHPRFNRSYGDLIYQPMLELLDYLRARQFKTFIVSADGVEFIRVLAEQAYGIPPEQVVGSSGMVRLEQKSDGASRLIKLPEVEFVNDGPGKSVGINRFIGRRPILAFGNSDGDRQMLEYVAAGSSAHFVGVIHHTDAEREFAYDRASNVGRLDATLDEAGQSNWSVVDMKTDWSAVFPPA